MWLFYTLLVLFAACLYHSVMFPLIKHRPVIVGGRQLALCVVFATALMQTFIVWAFLIGIIVFLLIFTFRPLCIYALANAMISKALADATRATRSTIENTAFTYTIDGSMHVRLKSMTEKFHIVLFRKIRDSKKSALTIIVFKKFMHNYYI